MKPYYEQDGVAIYRQGTLRPLVASVPFGVDR